MAGLVTSDGTATGSPVIFAGRVRGVEATLLLLQEFAPDLARKLNDEMRDVMRGVAEAPESKFPIGPGRWDGHGKSGFKVVKSRAKIGYTAVNAMKSAVITEFAGRVNPGGITPRGAKLISTLNERYGNAGRFLWSTWDDQADDALQRIESRARELEAEYNARLAAPAVI